MIIAGCSNGANTITPAGSNGSMPTIGAPASQTAVNAPKFVPQIPHEHVAYPAQKLVKARRPHGLSSSTVIGVNLPAIQSEYTTSTCVNANGVTKQWTYANCSYDAFYSPAVMNDIKNNLGADYVRLGFIPDWMGANGNAAETCNGATTTTTAASRFCIEDKVLQNACNAGLNVLILTQLYSPNGNQENTDSNTIITQFFNEMTNHYPGCIKWAELGNEADLDVAPLNGDMGAYATYYEEVASHVESHTEISLITAGTSGVNVQWVKNVGYYVIMPPPDSRPRVDGIGVNPYGTAPADMASAMASQISTLPGRFPNPLCNNATCPYATEVGETSAGDLIQSVENLDKNTPIITVYNYHAVPGDLNPNMALKNVAGTKTGLYSAYVTAANYVHSH